MPLPTPPNPIGYLVNQYPKVSHSFIRREIAAVEALGQPVARFTIRPADVLPDEDDRAEARRTRVLLDGGVPGLMPVMAAEWFRAPLRGWRALRQAVAMGRRSGRGVLRHLVYLAEACRLGRELRRQGATHLHAHFGTNPAAVARLTHTLTGIPYSFTVHGPEEFDAPEALSLREKITDAAFVVAVSSYGRGQLLRWADPADAGRVVEVRCGLDPAFFTDGVCGDVPDTQRLVCVGRLCEQKGQLLLCDAVALLRGRGVACRLELVGDGPMRPALERRIHDLRLTDRVEITGWASAAQVREHLRAARALVLPSFAEGLPVVIMEALALGRPVVCTFVAGIPELVDDACGVLVPAGSAEALADAMETVLTRPTAELSALGRAGAARVRLRHDARAEARKLLSAIQGSAAAAASPETRPAGAATPRAMPQGQSPLTAEVAQA